MTVQGITTDGSTLYPEPIVAVFGAVPHQVCQFHVLHEVNKAILSAVARNASVWRPAPPNCRGAVPARKRPSVPLGARSESSRRWVSCSPRYLFVQRRLSPSERATLQRISRGWPQLRACAG